MSARPVTYLARSLCRFTLTNFPSALAYSSDILECTEHDNLPCVFKMARLLFDAADMRAAHCSGNEIACY